MTEYCKAMIDAASTACSHNDERIKLYISYKNAHATLEAVSKKNSLCDEINIRACSSLETVREWNEAVRSRHRLLDFGHRNYWLGLVKQRDNLEALLSRLEGRAYDLILESQNALGCASGSPRTPSSECAHHAEVVRELTPAVPATDPAFDYVALKSAVCWEYVRVRLAAMLLPRTSRFFGERVAVVWAVVCRAIYVDPGLMLLAQKYEHVDHFLMDPDHDFEAGERLVHLLVRAAIDDVLRPVDDSGEYVNVLGHRLHKTHSGRELPFHAWGHVLAFRLCACQRGACRTMEEIIEYCRYQLFTASAPLCQSYKYDAQFPTARVLAICGMMLDLPEVGKRVSISKKPDSTWEEKRIGPIMPAAMSLSDPKSRLFLDECFRHCRAHPSLTMTLRKGKDAPIICSAARIQGKATRTASSLSALKKSAWNYHNFHVDDLLRLSQPPVGPGHCGHLPPPLEDCIQLTLVDSGEIDTQTLIDELLAIWKRVYGVDTLLEICHAVLEPYMLTGELEVDHANPSRPFIRNLGKTYVSYVALWGDSPFWKDLDLDLGAVDFPTVWSAAQLEQPSKLSSEI
ncbi:hypothetical protein B0H10DRAFT_2055389 [Mycena sp. CBHHK59/15]|nr:hypothetical protein B0H10DRAFT_2055389 [Mycena sp. CBHHK59/15]